MRHAVERDASANHIRIAAEPRPPEALGDDGDVGALFFLRQKVAAANRPDAEQIEIVPGQPAAEDLHRVAEAGQSERGEILGGEIAEDGLRVAVMHEAWRRQRNLVEVALFRVGVHVHNPVRLSVGETAQEQIVDQAEDGAVEADADRQRQQCKQCESGRLQQLAERKAKVSHHGCDRLRRQYRRREL